MKSSTILIALGFKQLERDHDYWHLKLANGDHLSYCTKDKSCGGAFGGVGWERNEERLDCIRSILEELKP